MDATNKTNNTGNGMSPTKPQANTMSSTTNPATNPATTTPVFNPNPGNFNPGNQSNAAYNAALNPGNPVPEDPMASAKKRRQELIAEIIAECEWSDPAVTAQEIEATIKDDIVPKTLKELVDDRGLNNSLTPKYFLWQVDYNTCVHFCTSPPHPHISMCVSCCVK